MSQGSRYQKIYDRDTKSKGPKPRKNFDEVGGVICKSCFTLKNENANLKEEIQRLKQKLNYREVRPDQAKGVHTPSSHLHYKASTEEENHLKKGGARVGHKGHGRIACKAQDADEVIEIAAPS